MEKRLFTKKEGKPLKVLIVDDEESVVMFMKSYFRRRKILAYVATSGHQALEEFKKVKPDLVLLDIIMEDLDGFEILKEIKKKSPDTKVIMITGRQDTQAKQLSSRLGADGFIRKPIVIEEFDQIISEIIKR